MMNYKTIEKCRGCDGIQFEEVFSLGMQPLANKFKLTSDEPEEKYPLKVLMCSKCSLAQLSIVVNPEILYADYPYVTQKGPTMTAHLDQLLKDFEHSIKGKKVLEIGSNDGHFLRMMIRAGASLAVGFEPCQELALVSAKLGSPTIDKVFNSQNATLDSTKFDTVFARHVFAHIDDWKDFFKGLETVTHEDSVVHIEVPYLPSQISDVSFDQIYHEHLSYIGSSPFAYFIQSIGWFVKGFNHYTIHGGSAVYSVVRKEPENLSIHKNLTYCATEKQHQNASEWKKFREDSIKAIYELKFFIEKAYKEGKIIYGYGASAKSTVFLNAMQLPDDAIKAMCDSTPQKQGKVCPGTSIVVVPESELILAQPDYAILFAWSYSTEIMEKNKDFKGHWVIPIPELTVV